MVISHLLQVVGGWYFDVFYSTSLGVKPATMLPWWSSPLTVSDIIPLSHMQPRKPDGGKGRSTMTYTEADAQYEVIKQQYLAGTLDDSQFEEQLHLMMVLDNSGLWWAKSRENGSWHFYDGKQGNWVAGTPPVSLQAVPPPSLLPSAPSTEPLPGQPHAALVLPGTSQGAPTTAGYSALDFGPVPDLTGGMKVLFYGLSLLLPILGLILYFVYRNKPALPDRSAARVFLILGIVSIVFSTMCGATFFLLEATMLGTGI